MTSPAAPPPKRKKRSKSLKKLERHAKRARNYEHRTKGRGSQERRSLAYFERIRARRLGNVESANQSGSTVPSAPATGEPSLSASEHLEQAELL